MAMEDPYIDTEETALERRDNLLKDVAPDIVRRAWFTLSHLLLDEGARVVDMGCLDGTLTYAMAAMNPKIRFIGLDKSKRLISKAKETYQLHNLEFKIGDAASDVFEPESLDAIINAYILHEVYSASRYNERIVSDTLRRQFKMLKKGGAMFIQDYASPPPGDYVLMEMPDVPSLGDDLAGMSEADLLVWYSQYARPRQDPGCAGFFLEELPPRFPRTRLFRLPHKWAYEFILRKDDRQHWETQLPMEYTFFTQREFRRELRAIGARVQYSGPYWDEELIEQRIEKNVRLYSDNGILLGPPPTCFITVAYKLAERKSLNIEERRPSGAQESKLTITAMRDQKTGRMSDVVSRGMDMSEIIPYRIDEEKQLKVYLHDGIAKSLTNAVPRRGINIDGRQWSGHMIEPVAVESSVMADLGAPDFKNTALFARNHLGLRPQENAVLEPGPEYYPSPDYIDERISTFYMKVEQSKIAVTPRNVLGHDDRYQAKGILREFDAQQILNAITVGMIPNARLELQLLSLFQRLNIVVENWTDKQLKLQAGVISGNKALRKVLNNFKMDQKRFKDIKGTAGQLRNVHSTFVEEGQARGSITGLTAQDIDFVIFDDRTINTAVILPLASEMHDEIHAGIMLDHMPVPERRLGNGLTASAISFNLPADVTNMKLAKKFIAEKFSVTPEMVLKMGECYYNHIGVTPQKIYPFAVALPEKFIKDPSQTFLPLYQIMLMWQALSSVHGFSQSRDAGDKYGNNPRMGRPSMVFDTNLMVVLGRSYKELHHALKADAKLQAHAILREQRAYRKPDWAIPLTYRQAPVIQQRMPVAPPPALERIAQSFITTPAPTPAISPTASVEPIASTAQQVDQALDVLTQTDPGKAAQITAKATQAQINPATLPNMLADFEKEIDEMVDELNYEDKKDLKPEKW
jgi:hypothetical protein